MAAGRIPWLAGGRTIRPGQKLAAPATTDSRRTAQPPSAVVSGVRPAHSRWTTLTRSVEGVVVAVEPQARMREHPAALAQRPVDLARVPASFAHPAPHEGDHARNLPRVHPGVGDRK